jgi:23S rRNA (guanosine2251-2'-O)-methyltransferase
MAESDLTYRILRCTRPGCGLRFPMLTGESTITRCPRCRAMVEFLYEGSLTRENPVVCKDASHVHLEVLLDNIRSAWNVGAIFRTADGLGLVGLHLAGITPTPENPAVRKISLGAEGNVAWDTSPDAVLAARNLLQRGVRLWALEITPGAVSLDDRTLRLPDEPVALVVGNEVCGVDPGVLDLCERSIAIPMRGSKRSLNVAIAFGIAAYSLLNRTPALLIG